MNMNMNTIAKAVIEFADAGERMRTVISRSNYRPTWKYPSIKTLLTHYGESGIELDAFRRLDVDTTVIKYSEQSARIRFPDNDGKIRTHYPDILVHFPGRKEFVEVKSDEEANSEEIQSRTRCLLPLLAELGYGYRVWTASEIRQGHRIGNIRMLLRYGRKPIPLQRFEAMRLRFHGRSAIAWGELTNTSQIPTALADSCRLVLEGRLVVDMDEYLDENSAVSLRKGDLS